MCLKLLVCISTQDNQTIYIEDIGEARQRANISSLCATLQKRQILRPVLIPAWPIVDHEEMNNYVPSLKFGTPSSD